jgi:hypothetical protein
LEELNNDSRAEPTRRIQTGGIVIMLNAPAQQHVTSFDQPVVGGKQRVRDHRRGHIIAWRR